MILHHHHEMQKRKPQGCFRANIPRPWRYKGGSKEAGKRYREKNSEKLKLKKREEYQRNKAKHREKSRLWRDANPEKWKSMMRRSNKKVRISLRSEMIKEYGGKCRCCNESQPLFLELDHVNNNGNTDRKVNGSGAKLLGRLKKVGWPKDTYQLLCSNCNQGKRMNGGICPHKNQ